MIRQIVEFAPDAVVVVDDQGDIVLVNERTESIFGYDRTEIIGQQIEILIPRRFHEGHRHLRNNYFSNPIRRRMASSIDLVAVRKDGGEFPVEISLIPLSTIEGKRVASIIRDVSEQKRIMNALNKMTEELLRSNKELEEFAAIASHDLQEPLRMITGFAKMLKKQHGEELGSNGNEFIDYIVDGAHRMQSLIKSLLSYSRLGQGTIKATLVDMTAVMRTNLQILAQKIQDASATVDCVGLCPVVADPVLLGELIQNLLSNALKFSSKERLPRITVRTQDSDSEWIVSISDNGIGIASEDFPRLFHLFHRAHQQAQYPGAGIGLASCKKIVERHGGRIWVESSLGLGTTVFFTLPKPMAMVEVACGA